MNPAKKQNQSFCSSSRYPSLSLAFTFLCMIAAGPAFAQAPPPPPAAPGGAPAASQPGDAPAAAPSLPAAESRPAAGSAGEAPSVLPPTETPPPAPAVDNPPPATAAPVAPPVPAPGDSAATVGGVEAPLSPEPLDVRMANLEGKVDGLDEAASATRSIVDRLNRIKLSGYIQGRYEWHGDSSDTVDASGNSKVKSQFLVRRGRLKAVYDGVNAEYLLQIDATPSGVVLKDAEATFVDTWTPFGLRLTVGQFKWPFGYEILQSSGDREMPERSLVIRTLFPGERDRGVRLTARYEWLRFAAALVNGNVPNGTTDRNGFKDLVGRVGGDFGWIVGGLSGYFGRRLDGKAATPLTTVWTDKNGDKMLTPDEVTTTPAAMASYQSYGLLRLGADVQSYVDVPGLGGLAVKGELIYGKDSNRAYGTTPANACLDRTQLGWIITAIQNLGDYAGIVARVDSFDPNVTLALPDSCTLDIAKGLGDRVNTYGFGALIYPSSNVKATFTYEHVAEQSIAIANDVFTAQLQARF